METLQENAEKTVNRSRSKHRAELAEEVLQLWDTDLPLNKIAAQVGCRSTFVVKVYRFYKGEQALVERKRRLYQKSKLGERNTSFHASARRCNDYGATQYTQVSGSTAALLQLEHEIVCSWRQRQAG